MGLTLTDENKKQLAANFKKELLPLEDDYQKEPVMPIVKRNNRVSSDSVTEFVERTQNDGSPFKKTIDIVTYPTGFKGGVESQSNSQKNTQRKLEAEWRGPNSQD